MDALRRAEANGKDTTQEETRDSLSEAAARPASNSPLQLEPLDAGATDTVDNTGTVDPAHTETEVAAGAASTTPVTPAPQAQSVLESFAVRKTSARKHLVFVVSGLLSATAILAAYYYWQSYTTRGYQVAPMATLIDAPAAGMTLADAGPAPQPVKADDPSTTAPPVAEPSTTSVAMSERAAPDAVKQPAVTDFTDKTAASDTTVERPVAPVVAGQTGDTYTAGTARPIRTTPDARIQIRRSSQTPGVPPTLQQAYQAYRQGDYGQAETLYRQVLKTYPVNRDAMLGLAAIALHQGRQRLARDYYQRLLQVDPSDRTALLALQGLSGGQYSLESGSKLKHWLREDRGNAQLHFALGNQYAASGQWKEAQQSYFDAQRLAPASADYAFNLAVSLDQLGLGEQALAYYLQAQRLAGAGALFNTARLDQRIRELQAAGEPRP